MFGILLHVIVKMENVQQVIWMIQQLQYIEMTESYDEETRTI